RRPDGAQHSAWSAPRRMNALTARELDDPLAELPKPDAFTGEGGVAFGEAEDVALLRRRIQTEQQIGRGKMKHAQRVGLKHLGIIHEPPLLDSGRRRFHREQSIPGFRAGHLMADRADSADSRHQPGHFVKRPALADLLKSTKLRYVEARGLDFAG